MTATIGESRNPAAPPGEARVVARDLSRAFGETKALVGAELLLMPGEIHALVGENGSGKSTLIKILSGVMRQDSGELRVGGEARNFSSPRAARAAGVATVFQETLVAPEMSVRDNIFFGSDAMFRHGHSRAGEIAGAHDALARLGLPDLNIDRPMWTLSLAERQLTTIARAIVRPWTTLVLDEATSALDASQRDRLFDYLRVVRSEGASVLFTSHRMDEVFRLADRITVLRAGQTVAQVATEATTQRELLTSMSGHATERREQIRGLENAPAARTTVLRAEEVVLRPGRAPISIEVRTGEIYGIAGLEGQGQVEFLECLCGLRHPLSGRVLRREGSEAEHQIRSYGDANRRGVRYVPRDRRYEGLFATLSVFDNFAIASWKQLNRLGLLRRGAASRNYEDFAASSRLIAGSRRQPIGTLSGGNQQKILLGRWISLNPTILLLNDPLRGVDANTKEELYEFFRRIAAEGVAVVFLSTEILELMTIADRIGVFYEGEVRAELEGSKTTDAEIIAAMFGEEQGHANG